MTEIRLMQGDITQVEVDAIVDAANSALAGVAESMARSTGPVGRP